MQHAARQHERTPAGWVTRSYPLVIERFVALTRDAHLLATIIFSHCGRLAKLTFAEFGAHLGYPTRTPSQREKAGTRCRRAADRLVAAGLLSVVDRQRGRRAVATFFVQDAQAAFDGRGLAVLTDSEQQLLDFGDYEEIEICRGLVEVRLFNPALAPDSREGNEMNPAPAPDLSQESGAGAGLKPVQSDASVGLKSEEDLVSRPRRGHGPNESGRSQPPRAQRIEARGDAPEPPPASCGTDAARDVSRAVAAGDRLARAPARASQTQEKKLLITQPSRNSNPDSDSDSATLDAATASAGPQHIAAVMAVQQRIDPEFQIRKLRREICAAFGEPTDWDLAAVVARDVIEHQIDSAGERKKRDYALRHGQQNPPGLYYTLISRLYAARGLSLTARRKAK